MNQDRDIYELGRQLGITETKIAKILTETNSNLNQKNMEGPITYGGALYGTISPLHFRFNHLDLFTHAKQLGLKETEITKILTTQENNTSPPITETGPNEYGGGYYGTISPKQFKNQESDQIYSQGKTLGLTTEEITQILIQNHTDQQTLIKTDGPINYPGGRYGTVSINAFKKQ